MSDIAWYSNILQNIQDSGKFKVLNTSDRFNESTNITKGSDLPDPRNFTSNRDSYLMFSDTSTDYFRHGLQVLYNKTPFNKSNGELATFDGYEQNPLRLSQVLSNPNAGTPYENDDPVLYGFELIIDSVSSPLLNGSVEDFINNFSMVSEIASKKHVIADFKQQFAKIFRTNGSIVSEPLLQDSISIPTSNYANTPSPKGLYEPGRKAYMSYKLKKVEGLNHLMETNTPDKKKYLVDYRKDVIKFSFTEDVSANIGTLAYLYKLLYWSKPLGKNIVPENILRFNCDIVISEIRKLNRVRGAVDTNNLEIIKENVSRYVYSLKECQFYFDQPPHENDIDMSQAAKEFDSFVVSMDFKYVTSRFERWLPDNIGFGHYVGYNSGALWTKGYGNVSGTQSASVGGTVLDRSIPKFYTNTNNSLRQNGVTTPMVLSTYKTSDYVIQEDSPLRFERVPREKTTIEKMEDAAAASTQRLLGTLKNAAEQEIKSQINIRAKLLSDSLFKIKNSLNVAGIRPPRNVYQDYNINDFLQESLKTFVGDTAMGLLSASGISGNVNNFLNKVNSIGNGVNPF